MKTRMTVLRHPKERRSKCSLTPLEGRPDLTFLRAHSALSLDATGYTLLRLGASRLTAADAGRPLLLLDSTWRLLPQLEASLRGAPTVRSLPPVRTAYPRVSKIAEDPLEGLASIEALYLAKFLLGERDDTLLSGYRWAKDFLRNLSEAGIQI